MEKGDIITAVTISGEYVGKLNTDDVLGSFELLHPKMILSNPETGEMGFARGIAVTGQENPESVVLHTVVFVCKANDKVVKAWQEATSSIVTPGQPKLVK
tara:strand:+ start:505 stop:804 length:300 start_codon:yes stop_codon:yes gene_type:complete